MSVERDESLERVTKAIHDAMTVADGVDYLTAKRYAAVALDEVAKIGNELMDAYGITERLPKKTKLLGNNN